MMILMAWFVLVVGGLSHFANIISRDPTPPFLRTMQLSVGISSIALCGRVLGWW